MTTVSHARTCGRFIEIKSYFRRKNFVEGIKAPIFLEADLAIEKMRKPRSNAKEEDNASI